ncbi:hypothetical protein QBC34DRAFT_217652 [Podospora aff. communis PSN243]|uniref:Methyltransferase type 11 domain-containing protein n=1 Tax=Podospora aff. communis PSN243 TaxID=3040156 RepID=A0AAV9H2M3_9PEZI|nr:hypothetical protein QBC34DRAFT_217652 [Podospora aff. communis PSN243]
MFDVDWADYEIEKVGERRARKEVERDQKKKEERRSVRESVSSRSSYSSGDKTQGFLGSLGLKISSASLRGRKTSSNTLRVPADDSSSRRASILSQPAATTAASVAGPSDDVVSPENKLGLILPPIDGLNLTESTEINGSTETSDNSTYRSSKGSVISKSTAATTLTVPSPCKNSIADSVCTVGKIAQPSGSGILVTKTTETRYELRDNTKPAEELKAQTVFSAPFRSTPSYSEPSSPTSPKTDVSASVLIDKWFTSVNDTGSPLSPATGDETPATKDEPANGKMTQVSFDLERPQEYTNLKPPSSAVSATTRSSRRKNTTSVTKLRADNPDAWKPPDNWSQGAPEAKSAPNSAAPSPRRQDTAQHIMSLDLVAMQREIARMAAASAEIVTVRLNENWGNSTDASFYRELEMEKKRWMLSALHNMQMYTEGANADHVAKDSGEGKKMLALFESQATASYLAASYPEAQFTHISPQPLSTVLFPNVKALPLAISGLLPLATNRYSKVFCLCLPSMMPSQEIPRLLRTVHRCLTPKGILHLTVIDPSPATQSLGPKMRHWLDQNLILNLESQFRCISPSRLLPAWLADARLRANGSVISRVKCELVCKTGQDGASAEAQLRSTVGRKLWQEVWGSFVHGTTWWWDDPECIAECIELGTHFEYSLIEAVKDTV